jgi:haloalkane dehalogenase
MKKENLYTWIDREEYPFKQFFFHTSGGKMHYVDEGTGNPIVFVHGNPAWSFLFRNVIKELSKTHRCIAPDHIGFGLSEKPKEWSYLPEEHAKNFENLLEKLELKNITIVVGDWGGPIGMSYAINHPEKIKNIVITNTWLWSVKGDWYYQAFSRFMGGYLGRWLIKRYNFFTDAVFKKAFGNKKKLSEKAHNYYLMALQIPEERKGCWTFPKHIINSSDWLSSLWARCPLLKEKNVLIVWGMKDIAFREKELQKWEGMFPSAKIVRLETAGHFLAEEEPEKLTKAIKTLF